MTRCNQWAGTATIIPLLRTASHERAKQLPDHGAGQPGAQMRQWLSAESGAATVVVAFSLAVLALSASVLVASGALVERQVLASAADAAALAAADTAVGFVSGVPCERAEQTAVRNHATMVDCTVEGFEVRVTVSRQVMGMPIRSSARAAPAPHASQM
ncbi:Rv3654c family TadE-like protein [Lysinibacter cavernae]|uniref:Secretion/DNA translocation related TadE-like protein n=1 Tax=Lysinibacter cavernae TaxID=1640652 RepID=A0A7X5TUF0_9MICO|nr:Rv3654c family TadE-like protein [Lysinibacter cavernae]NIH55225.1 secretion/DNA translocation related TadE-like protein [Lysinibacter cavernae]